MLFAFWSGLTYHDHMTGNANGNAGTSGLDGNSTSSPFVLVNETSSPDPGTDNGTAPGSSVTSCPFLEDAGGHRFVYIFCLHFVTWLTSCLLFFQWLGLQDSSPINSRLQHGLPDMDNGCKLDFCLLFCIKKLRLGPGKKWSLCN